MEENIKNNNPSAPLHPGWLIPITLVSGLIVSGPLSGAILRRCGHRKAGWIAGSLLGLTGFFILTFSLLLNIEWYWTTMILLGMHLISGVGLYFGLRITYRKFIKEHKKPLIKAGTYREIIAGAAAGALLSGLMGMIFTIVYLLVADRLFSTLMLVIYEDRFALFKIIITTLSLTVIGALAGGFMGRFRPYLKPGQIILYALVLIWSYLTMLLALEITITIPGFQAMMATGTGLSPITLPFLFCGSIIGLGWTVFLLFFAISPVNKRGKFCRIIQVLGINLAAGITLSIYMGYPADMFLSLGKYCERKTSIPRALQYYERGLNKKPKKLIASYLQYRVALLNHKMDNRDKAVQGFRRVVTKYTANKKLVAKSTRFFERLKQSNISRRVVLPGIETRMEYQAGSCAPNSLALVMRHWDINITARLIAQKIKGFNSGTLPQTQAWFAKQYGLCHDFIPLAASEDIKKCIDAGFPVLVIVPQHIFAIFGYDEALKTFITFDTAVLESWVDYDQKDFIKVWKKTGAPLLLVYPPDKKNLIPNDIKTKLESGKNNYLALWNYFIINEATNRDAVPYLLMAAGNNGDFFIPLTILYNKYPKLRKVISRQYNTDFIAAAIKEFFWNDFDEGKHSAGQRHNKNRVVPDKNFRWSMDYLIGEGQFDIVKELVRRVQEKGPVSASILQYAGMIALAEGNFKEGLDLLFSQEHSTRSLMYSSMVDLQKKQNESAIRGQVRTINAGLKKIRTPHKYFRDSKNMHNLFYLDRYGFPQIAITNNLLVQNTDFGQNRKMLEENWEFWIHRLPFDTPVAKAQLKLYEERIDRLKQEEDVEEYQRLTEKINLIKSRIKRYGINNLSEEAKKWK